MAKETKNKAGKKVRFIRKGGKIIPITVKSNKSSYSAKKGKSIKIEKNSDLDRAGKHVKKRTKQGAVAGATVGGGVLARHLSHGSKGTLKGAKAGKRLKYLGKMAKTSRGRAGLMFGATMTGLSALSGSMFGAAHGKVQAGNKLTKKYGKKLNMKTVKAASKANKTGL